VAGAVAFGFLAYGHPSDTVITGAHAMIAAAFVVFALMIAGAFFGQASRATVTAVRIDPALRPPGRPTTA
jgi:hypothetical protein